MVGKVGIDELTGNGTLKEENPGANVIKVFTAVIYVRNVFTVVIYRHSIVIVPFCVKKLYHLGN